MDTRKPASPFLEEVRNAIRVRHYRNGKGGKDRVVTFSDVVVTPVKQQLEHVKMLHDKDLADGFGEVYLLFALARKYPNAPREWHW